MTYPGGKNGAGVYQTIINQMPPHRVYVEAFLGAGAIMRNKFPATENIGIECDASVIQRFWKDPSRVVSNLQIIHCNTLEWLDTFGSFFTSYSLIYFDPPYLMETRRQQAPLYGVEFGEPHQHAELLKAIKQLNCMVMISGYWSELYAKELAGWRTVKYQAMTRGGTMATEWLWMNYPEPLELHDYRYLGENFRQRERIKRKQARWRNRMANMTSTERYAMLSVLADLRSEASPETARVATL